MIETRFSSSMPPGLVAENALGAEFSVDLGVQEEAEKYYLASLIEIDRGAYEAAEVCLRRAVRLAPEHVEAQYRLGLIYAHRGDFEIARRCLSKALGLVRRRGIAGVGLAALISSQLDRMGGEKSPKSKRR